MEPTHTLTRLSVAMSLALLMSACNGSGTSAPTAPTRYLATSLPDVPPPAPATYTLSGVVSEMAPTGLVPVEDVKIQEMSCVASNCVPYLIQSATTDGNGFYSISGVYGGKNNYFWAGKAGYDDPVTESPPCEGGCHTVSVDGDTRFDMQLARR